MKLIPFFSVILVMFLGPSKCSDKKLQKNAPIAIGDVYYERWDSEPATEDSGFNLFIPITEKNVSEIVFDSVYFRNQMVKLTRDPSTSEIVYIAEFQNPQPSNKDIIMSSDPLEEMANKPPVLPKPIPYKLEPTEAIVSFNKDGKTLYFKIKNILEKPPK